MTNCIILGRHLTSLALGFPFCRAEMRLLALPRGGCEGGWCQRGQAATLSPRRRPDAQKKGTGLHFSPWHRCV